MEVTRETLVLRGKHKGQRTSKDFVGLCANVVGSLPRCMDMITADHVISRIDGYFQGGTLPHCTRSP